MINGIIGSVGSSIRNFGPNCTSQGGAIEASDKITARSKSLTSILILITTNLTKSLARTNLGPKQSLNAYWLIELVSILLSLSLHTYRSSKIHNTARCSLASFSLN